MTTIQTQDAPESQEPSSNSQPWGDLAVNISGQIAQYAEHSRGDLAELRRMNPDEPDAPAFWRTMSHHDLLSSGPVLEPKWGLILHGIALMTPTNVTSGSPQSAHDSSMPVGRALFLGSEAHRGQALYSESRLNRLLTARGPMLRILLARMFRMLAASKATFNWREMSQLILNEGYNKAAFEQGRRRIAREYYRAARRPSQTGDSAE